jgi:hypothetical protein
MDRDMENKWLMDSGYSQYMTGDEKWFSRITPLSHKEYVTFGDDKKGKVLGTSIVTVNNHFILNDVSILNKLRYKMLSISQFVDADLGVLFHKSGSKVIDSRGDLVFGISHTGKVF